MVCLNHASYLSLRRIHRQQGMCTSWCHSPRFLPLRLLVFLSSAACFLVFGCLANTSSMIGYFWKPSATTPEEAREASLAAYQNISGIPLADIVIQDFNQWDYFPHVSKDALDSGYYQEFGNLQGVSRQYYTGSFFAFESVAESVKHAEYIVRRTSPAERRRLRDTALQQWETALRRVNCTLKKAQTLLEVLVPSVDQPMQGEQPQLQPDNEPNMAESDDEDDDLDWEEGDHEAAVDRTLQAMVEAGTVQDGGVEVAVQPQAPLADTVSRAKLQKITSKLQKQLEVLSAWVDALNTSDTMVSMNGGALVQMNSEQLRHRKNVYHSLSDLKQRVATTIASCVSLGLSTTRDNGSAPPARRSNVTSLHLERPSQTVRPVIRHERARSNRVQVKYRKDV